MSDPQPRGGILALDLSLTSGFAYGPADRTPQSGVWSLPPRNPGAALAALEDRLTRALDLWRPTLVVFESPLLDKRQTSARLLIGLAAITEMVCWRSGVICCEQSAQTIRAGVLGQGRFPQGTAKGHVLRWCHEQGWRPEDDNAADALVTWRFAVDAMQRCASQTRR